MNDSEDLNVLQIIRRGNINLARVWLQATFLVADIPDDLLLVECTLTKIEMAGASCELGREALNRVYLILDDFPEDKPEKARLMDRWQALDHLYPCFET